MRPTDLVLESMHGLLRRGAPELALAFARGIARSGGDIDAVVACRLAQYRYAADWRKAFELGCRHLTSRARQRLTRAALIDAATAAGSSDAAMEVLASLVRKRRFYPLVPGLYLLAAAAGGRSVDLGIAPPLAWEAGVFVTQEDCTPEAIARIIAIVRPSARPNALVGELAQVIDRVPPPLAGDDFRDDPLLPVQLAPSPIASTDRLLVCMTGVLGRMGMPMGAFHRWAARSGAHVLYLRDLVHQDFRNGVDVLGTDFAQTAAFVRDLAAMLSIEHVATWGNSAGAVAAARLGLMVGAKRMVVAAGVTSPRKSAGAAAESGQPPTPIAELFAREVRELVRANSLRAEILWIYAEGHEKDNRDARGMADVPGITLMPLPISRHNVAPNLVSSGAIDAVFDWVTGSGTPSFLDQARSRESASAREPSSDRLVTLPTGEVMRRIDHVREPWKLAFTGPDGLMAAIDRAAREHPDALAVVTPDERATFAEVVRLSMALAGRIGTASAAPVLVLGRADLALVATTLACQRIGRAVAPIDPGISALRLQQMVLSSGADVLVRRPTQAPPIAALQEDRIRTVLFDRTAPAPDRVPPPADGDGIIVFTSGSTGVPKGVRQPRTLVASTVAVQLVLLGIGTGDRVAVVTPAVTITGPSFTPMPLAAGATLVLLPESTPMPTLLDMLEGERPTHLHCYVGLARAIATHRRAVPAFAGLRTIQIYGDVIRQQDCDALRAVLPPQARIHLAYGSTEANLAVDFVAGTAAAAADGRMPLGTPLQDMEMWLRLATPDADAGEIHAAGPRVIAGYTRDPSGRGERFRPHPTDPARTLFMMGDLVRLRADGQLEFAGRVDNQVKLRGWRIELEDIESAARAVPGVKLAAVVPRRGALGIVQSLVLHIATDEAETSLRERLQRGLAEALPAQMVPARTFIAPTLPLTATGKVDRVRLAEIDSQARDASPDEVPQDNAAAASWPDPLAARIAGVIADEARLGSVAPEDNLNALGVDSLMAINIALRIDKQWGVELEPAEILERQSVGSIVAAVVARTRR